MIDTQTNGTNNPRHITHIVVHCTATQQTATIDNIQRYWRVNLEWKNPGYHYIIPVDGSIVSLLPETISSNGVAGHNSTSVHICYIGGVDVHNNPVDNRTDAQKATLLAALQLLKKKYPFAVIQGHRDFPGVKKACPCFDAKTAYAGIK